jgi:hypothetical protein
MVLIFQFYHQWDAHLFEYIRLVDDVSLIALSGWLFRQVLVGKTLGHFFRDSAEVAVK